MPSRMAGDASTRLLPAPKRVNEGARTTGRSVHFKGALTL